MKCSVYYTHGKKEALQDRLKDAGYVPQVPASCLNCFLIVEANMQQVLEMRAYDEVKSVAYSREKA